MRLGGAVGGRGVRVMVVRHTTTVMLPLPVEERQDAAVHGLGLIEVEEVAACRDDLELEPRGEPFDDAGEAGAMRLPGRDQAQRHARKLRRRRACARRREWPET